MAVFLAVLVCLLASCSGQPGDVVWYVNPTSTADPETCGGEPAQPCASVEAVFAQSLLVNASATCVTSQGDRDGRTSTTVFIMGSVFVPAVCLHNWHNLHVSSYPPGSEAVVNTDRFGQFSIFGFYNSSNVTLQGLVFNTSSQNRQNLYFEGCTDVALRNCSMPLSATNGYGMEIRASSGHISVEDCQFYNDPSVAGGNNHGIALRIVTGNEDVFNDATYPPMEVVVRRCEFRDLRSYGPPQDSYRQALSSALSMLVQLRSKAYNNQLLVEDSHFHNISNSIGHSITVHFDSGSVNNSAVFSRCHFEENTVRYGGGVATYFSGGTGSLNGSLEISDCNFTNNRADFEGGGVFVAFLQEDIANQVAITRCQFQGNQALYGAAVFLFNNPAWFTRSGPPDAVALPLTPTILDHCVFIGNNASLEEGVVNTLRIILAVTNVTFLSNNGSCILLRLSLAYLEGQLLFQDNIANRGAAISVLDRSRVDLRQAESAVFRGNTAVVSGGAIFGDDSSTSFTANEYNHSVAENRFGFCFTIFGNEGHPGDSETPGRVVFENNFAFGDGLAISAYSLRGCQISNFVPDNIAQFLPIQSDGNNVFNGSSELGTTTTGPSYLFFYGASSSCYKPVGNVTYLLPNCSHSLINSTFHAHPGLECSLTKELSEMSRYYGPGAALMPTVDKLITPWAGIETSWTLTPGLQREQCGEQGEEVVPGQIHLAPAPGEQFDLTVQLADQLLNYVSTSIYMEVEHASVTTPPGVLLQLNGIQYSFNDRVFFTPNRALSGVALVGFPGTEGNLRIVAASQVRGQDVVLLIPFKLAQCPLGYFPPPGAASLEEVNTLLTTDFKDTQRIPDSQPLACNCLNETGPPTVRPHFTSSILSLAHTCIRGYTVELNSVLWAGLIPLQGDSAPLYPPTVPCPEVAPDSSPVSNSLSTFILEARGNTSDNLTSDPVDVVTYEGGVHPGGLRPILCFDGNNISQLVAYRADGEFSVEFCTRGYCQGDVLSSWFLSDEGYPCISDRKGLLCGECRSGYALTTYSTICRDCRDAIPAIPVLLTLGLGLGFVIVVVALNFEASPTVDSLLFFTQALYILLAGRANYEVFQYLAFFNPDFTFNLCLSPDLAALGRLGLQYATPLYILSLLLLLLLLTRVKVRWLSQRLGRHSFLKSLWFLILISYLNIAHTTFELLHCRMIGPSNGERRQVLDHDASITCYQGGHLAAATFAILSAIFLVLPFPFYVAVLLYFPRFKPFTDVYTFMYRDWRRLWVSWSLGRRLLLVLLGVFVTDFTYRHFSLLLGLLGILMVDVATWPYRSHTDNLFAILLSWLLVVIATLTQPDLYVYVDPHRGPSGALVLAGVLGSAALVVVERMLWRRGDTVDGVVGRFVGKWKEARQGLWGRLTRKEEPEDLTKGHINPDITASSVTMPRYRESLLEQLSPEEDGGGKKRAWHCRKKRGTELEVSQSQRKEGGRVSSNVVFSSVEVADNDSGVATVTSEYSRDSNDATYM